MSRNINKRMNSLHWNSAFYFMILLLVFTRVRTVAMRDIDANGYNICDIESRTKCDMKTTYCRNFNGTYKCLCKPGYQETTNPYYCTDINECSRTEHYFCNGENNSSYCLNTFGSWECLCKSGFKARKITENLRTCEDINECTDLDYSCHGGECINIPGGWYCDCPAGYTNETAEFGSRHVICEDINECLDVSAACLHASDCVNTVGSWKCICSEGLKETVWNETSRICTGEYQYVASVSFTLTGAVTNVGRLQIAIKKKILDMYLNAFKDTNVWIEIIKINGLSGSARRKRSIPVQHEITAEYIIHTTEEKTQDQLENVETVYKDKICNKQTEVCEDRLDGYSILFSVIVTEVPDAICETKNNVCDKVKSTCSSKNGQLQCNCTEGYTKTPGDENSLLCTDVNECNNDQACPNGTTCHNTAGSWDCSCNEGLKAIETTAGNKECLDPCSRSKCDMTSTCKHYDNEDGYICDCQNGRKGNYCEEIDHDFKESKQQTTLTAVGSSLGGLVLILIAVILGVSRWRAGKIKEAEKISLKHMDTNGFKSLDDLYLTNQYRDGGGGSFYSHRLSNISLPREQQNDGNRNGYLSDSVKLPRLNFYGSMPNLAKDDANFNRYDNRRYSVEEPRRVSSNNQGLEANYDIDWRAPKNNVNGRRSPPPDYGRPRSPIPDYGRREILNRSKDSGVGKGYTSGSNKYRGQGERMEYYSGNRLNTNF